MNANSHISKAMIYIIIHYYSLCSGELYARSDNFEVIAKIVKTCLKNHYLNVNIRIFSELDNYITSFFRGLGWKELTCCRIIYV